MKPVKTIVLFAVLLIAQTLVFSRLQVFNSQIDLLLVFTILVGIFFGPAQGLIAGIISGFFMDILTFPFYIQILSRGLIGYIAGILKQQIFKEDNAVLFLIIFFCSFFIYILEAFLLVQFFDSDIINFIKPILASSLLNMLPVLVIARFVRNLASYKNEFT